MSEQETELTLSEEASAAIAAAEEAEREEQARQAAAEANPDAPVARAEFDQLKAERDQLLDRLARLQAEFENARKRAERERIDFRDYAVGSVVEQLRTGVELIVKQMEDVLRQLNVVAVPALGEEFDPRQHEALGSVERADLPDQQVAEEVRRGYRLHERLLRPALVRVAHNPKQINE